MVCCNICVCKIGCPAQYLHIKLQGLEFKTLRENRLLWSAVYTGDYVSWIKNTLWLETDVETSRYWTYYLLTYLLTPWSRVLLEKLTASAASQGIPRIFGTWSFITVLTSARHLSLSWANSIQSPQPSPTSWRSILILSSHLSLGLPNGLFPSGFPYRTLYTPLPCPIRAY